MGELAVPTFATPKPIVATVELAGGSVRVSASERADTVVDVRPRDAGSAADTEAAEQTRVEYADGRLSITAPKRPLLRSRLGAAPAIEVDVSLPEGSELDANGACHAVSPVAPVYASRPHGHERSRMTIRFPGESTEYRAARDRLLEQEIELRRATEKVAAVRRALPPGGVVPEDYVFQAAVADGAPGDVRLSELFAAGKDSLVIYNFMFPRDPDDTSPGPLTGQTARLPLAEGPCPSCTALLDQLDGAAEHAGRHVNLVVVAKTSLPRLLTFGKERGWRHLRLLSSAGNAYNRDYLGETAEGTQRPMLNVFHRDRDAIRHFWASELFYAPTEPGEDPRHVGTLEPLWNLLDLTPEGRPADWYEQLSY